jgi:hypothetical protein
MSITDQEIEQMRRIYHSDYKHLQVKKQRNFYAIDEETAETLVKKGLADYNHLAMTKFCRLTSAGISVIRKKEGK